MTFQLPSVRRYNVLDYGFPSDGATPCDDFWDALMAEARAKAVSCSFFFPAREYLFTRRANLAAALLPTMGFVVEGETHLGFNGTVLKFAGLGAR